MLPKADLPARVFSTLYRATWSALHALPQWARPVAATLDLRKGYKQLFPHPTELRANVITYVASGVRCYRLSYALLFGALSSVNHFNRVTPR